MKVGIFDPYLDSLGGGERYALTLAEHLISKNYQVDIFWDDKNLRSEIKNRLSLNMDKARFVNNIFTRKNLLEKLIITSKYDLIFFLSDGSIPTTLAKKNILHFQVPFNRIRGKTFLNTLKLSRFNRVVCNSYFTKKFIDKTYGVKSLVLYPPVDTTNFEPGEKRNLILTVGRFSNFPDDKKQEVMIEVFKKMVEKGLTGWEMYLIGGLLESDREFFQKLESQICGYPIRLWPNISFDRLKKYYSQAKIYWHAKGFSEDEGKNPQALEHFGISCVEAMAAGAVPLVFDGGGLREIIKDGSGLLWQTQENLQNFTLDLIKNEKKLLGLGREAQKRAKDFSKETFLRRFDETILG